MNLALHSLHEIEWVHRDYLTSWDVVAVVKEARALSLQIDEQ